MSVERAAALILILALWILPGCSGNNGKETLQGKALTKSEALVDSSQEDSKGPVDRILTEDEAYQTIKNRGKKKGLPVYKPSYTAGFVFSPVDPWEKPYLSSGDTVWYRKGALYFRIINNLAGGMGDMRTQSIGQINEYPAVMNVNGLSAWWNETHNIDGTDRVLSYGLENYRAGAPPKLELLKVVKSMKPVQ